MSIEPDSGPRPIFLVAGEASGDLHAAHLATELRRQAPDLPLVGLGGPRMAGAGVDVLYPLVDELAVMGIVPVLTRLPKIGRILDETYDHLDRLRPRALLLIDYPGFNLHLARYAHRRGIPILYYIVPQLWAWGHWRLRRVRRLIDRMLVIFPFEEKFYRDRGIDARFVGHPLTDELSRYRPPDDLDRSLDLDGSSAVIGLLPGSRRHEIERILPIAIAAAVKIHRHRPDTRFLLGLAHARHRRLVESIVDGRLELTILENQTHDIMHRADLCLVTSGTATVETAWFGTPMLILYRIGRAAHLLARSPLGIRTDHIGMVNILAGSEIAPEFLMVRDESESIAATALEMLDEGPRRRRCVEGLEKVRKSLEVPSPSRRAAEEVLTFLRERA